MHSAKLERYPAIATPKQPFHFLKAGMQAPPENNVTCFTQKGPVFPHSMNLFRFQAW